MKHDVFSKEGKKTGSVELSDTVFGLPWNSDLVHQVIVALEANKRTPVAHTKTRGEVRGGGKKPWRQKGTGRARHGSTRSPIWIGGGVTFGPRNDRDFSKKVNRKTRNKALAVALSQKLRDGEVLLVEKVEFQEPKTKYAKEILTSLAGVDGFEKLSTKRKNAALIIAPEVDENTKKSFQNMGNVQVESAMNANVSDTLKYKYIILLDAEGSVSALAGRLSK